MQYMPRNMHGSRLSVYYPALSQANFTHIPKGHLSFFRVTIRPGSTCANETRESTEN